jgi:hypothetical protein
LSALAQSKIWLHVLIFRPARMAGCATIFEAIPIDEPQKGSL